jgi:hypothetical protein
MKRRSIYLTVILAGLLLWGCYPQGADFTEDYDVVLTNYNDQYDFAAKGTYAMPDSIVKITGNVTEGKDVKYLPNATAQSILSQIKKNMTSLGWTLVKGNANPDIVLLPVSWETTTIYYYYNYWGYWYGWYYPYWGYPSYYSYTTGTLLMTIMDKTDIGGNGNPINEWTGALSGILNYSYSAARVQPLIDQAFKQSPYLKTN